MKLLIVDDEKHVITAVRCLIPAKELGISDIFCVQTAAEAKTVLEKERPELAIVDIILQNQTGMNLMAFILNKHLPTQVIAISGHRDYEYVRTMLLNGAVDYLLKPIESKALVASLQKAIARLSPAEPSAPQAQPAASSLSLSAQYMRVLLRKMLMPSLSAKVYDELCTLDAHFRELKACTLLYYDLDYLPTTSDLFHQHLNLFEEKLKSYLSLNNCGFLLDKFSSQHERLIVLTDTDASQKRKVEAAASAAFASTALSFHMGCSGCKRFPEEFREGYSLANHFFFAVDTQATPEFLQEYSEEPVRRNIPYSRELETELLSLIVAQDADALAKAVGEWLTSALGWGALSLNVVRDVIKSYNGMHVRWVARIREVYPNFSVNSTSEHIKYTDFLDEFFAFSQPMMVAGILRSMRQFAERFSAVCTTEDIFRQIAFYMDLNYDKPFHQAEYARLFHLNKDYLSRKFKQVFGEGMISYINRLRIAHAETLLHDPEMKIRDIAYQTGYGDEKYFTRQFKAARQITPSEYRELLPASDRKPQA